MEIVSSNNFLEEKNMKTPKPKENAQTLMQKPENPC